MRKLMDKISVLRNSVNVVDIIENFIPIPFVDRTFIVAGETNSAEVVDGNSELIDYCITTVHL